jgi:hypothetical protein
MRLYLLLVPPLLVLAAPASAQIWGGPVPSLPGRANIAAGHGEIGQIRDNIRNGRQSGQLTRREARQLRREAAQIGVLEARYAAGGLSPAEEAELYVRREALRNDVVVKRSDGRRR